VVCSFPLLLALPLGSEKKKGRPIRREPCPCLSGRQALVVAKSSAGHPLALPLAVAFLFFLCVLLQPTAAEEKEATTVVTKEGLHFKLPPDWPVEKRGGVVAPIPIEEYLAQKFSAIQSRLQALEQQMVGLELKLRVMEEELKRRKEKGLQSTETGPA